MSSIQDEARALGRVAIDGSESITWRMADHIDTLEARVAELEGALDALEKAEAHYRQMHDLEGDGSPDAGRAWDLMRRAGNNARAALNAKRGDLACPTCGDALDGHNDSRGCETGDGDV